MGLDSKTVESYNIALNKFTSICGTKPVNDYTREDYHKFVNELDCSSQNTKSVYTKRIYALYNWMLKERIVTTNPMKRVQEKQKEFKIKTKEEIDSIIEHSRKTKFYWLVRFQSIGGFRISEVISTRVKDIEKDIIRVIRKGNVPNYIPITQRMKNLLSEMPIPENPDNPLSPSLTTAFGVSMHVCVRN